jgi:hypothetical protein
MVLTAVIRLEEVLMQDKKALMEQLKNKYLKRIKNIPSIEFVDWCEELPSIAHDIFLGNESTNHLSIISRKETDAEAQLAWIINLLKEQNIVGTYLLAFDGLPFAKVRLGSDYLWVQTVWYGHYMTFVTVDGQYLVDFRWTESCIGSDCFEASYYRKP